jgi:hypothetical protein
VTRYCDTVDAQFCADFDIPNDAGAHFFAPATANGYTLDFENSNNLSSPTAMRAIAATDSGGVANVSTVIGDAGPMSKIILDIDLYVPAYDGGPTPTPLFAFALGAGAPAYHFGLAHDGQSWRLEDQLSKSGPAMSTPLAGNEWIHATLDMVLNTSSGTVSLTVKSSAGTATAQIGPIPTTPTSNLPMILEVGMQADNAPVLPSTFLYDNVVVRYQ